MVDPRSPLGTRVGLALVAAGTVAIGVAYAATIAAGHPPAWAPWLLVLGAAATPVGLFAMGAVTRGVLSRGVAILLGALFVVLFASFGVALAMPPTEGAGGPLLFGLPFRLAVVFYGVGFVPLLALPVAFALTFRDVAPVHAHEGAGPDDEGRDGAGRGTARHGTG